MPAIDGVKFRSKRHLLDSILASSAISTFFSLYRKTRFPFCSFLLKQSSPAVIRRTRSPSAKTRDSGSCQTNQWENGAEAEIFVGEGRSGFSTVYRESQFVRPFSATFREAGQYNRFFSEPFFSVRSRSAAAANEFLINPTDSYKSG